MGGMSYVWLHRKPNEGHFNEPTQRISRAPEEWRTQWLGVWLHWLSLKRVRDGLANKEWMIPRWCLCRDHPVCVRAKGHECFLRARWLHMSGRAEFHPVGASGRSIRPNGQKLQVDDPGSVDTGKWPAGLEMDLPGARKLQVRTQWKFLNKEHVKMLHKTIRVGQCHQVITWNLR